MIAWAIPVAVSEKPTTTKPKIQQQELGWRKPANLFQL